jgi:TetR/AcrR family fatty acid metabolism transcriptional regulator
LLIKVFEKSLAGIIKRFEADLAKEPDPVIRLKRFIWAHLELLEENQALAEVIQVELRQSNKFMKEYVPTRFFEYLNIIADLVREGQKAGQIRPEISPGIFKRALFGALDEISLHWVLRKKGRDYLKSSGEQLCEIFLGGILKEGIKL